MSTITVQGMKCQHCAAGTRKALEEIEGISDVRVNLETGEISFEGDAPMEIIKAAVAAKGYTVVE
ncbi:MAG TPA: heavy-metal-associated domain-containing protein [Desulfobulbaceae bacterium]|nr:heavy-metal-associated domain-containing protein [Desulfobulbaceae bacterium]